MAFKISLLLAVVAALVALLVFRNPSLSSFRNDKGHDSQFKDIVGNLSSQRTLWLSPSGRKVETYVFLLQFGADFLLIDAGVPGEEYADSLLEGLGGKIETGQLRLVLLTHGHIDHVGALPALKQAFPDAHVAFHTDESPYLTGGVLYNNILSDHDQYDMTKVEHDVSVALPESRVLHLRGSSGDVADAFTLTGLAPKWLPPRGAVQFHHMPGHSPGQVAYLHMPSGSLIAGDSFNNLGRPAALAPPTACYTPNVTQASLSVKALAALQYKKAFCTHDAATPAGVTRAAMQTMAASL